MANEAPSGRRQPRFRSEVRMVLRRARERLKMSQAEFAASLGVSQSQVSDWERGRFEPSASVLLAAAEMANMSIDELRGAGPAALVERIERLEEGEERLTEVDMELERIGELLATMIEVLDDAGLWHVGGADADRASSEDIRKRTRARREASGQ